MNTQVQIPLPALLEPGIAAYTVWTVWVLPTTSGLPVSMIALSLPTTSCPLTEIPSSEPCQKP